MYIAQFFIVNDFGQFQKIDQRQIPKVEDVLHIEKTRFIKLKVVGTKIIYLQQP